MLYRQYPWCAGFHRHRPCRDGRFRWKIGHDHRRWTRPWWIFAQGGIRPQAIPDAAKQAMLNLKVQNLQATATQQQQQIETLTDQLKEQAAQIQKVNAQLEMNKPATKVIANKP